LLLQRVYSGLYGWQDRVIEWQDRAAKKRAAVGEDPAEDKRWYLDKRFLTLVCPLCLCTNNMIVVVFSLFGRLDLGLLMVLVAGNSYLLAVQIWKIRRHGLRQR